ncbi:uncharacterized protein LOC107035617 [Diachasma alloeum]|uniref:uncharacterized protein LOC107035617 n=1 Tax=Diachasma alloeum TaxID=454923 RepID=UPI0007383EDC|nr:uncharacterized protein LOC107035617 [Diachasma alloeum]
MPQLSWPAVAVIAVFGAIFTMTIPETESRSSSTFEHIRHRPNKSASAINSATTSSSTVRCSGKRRIEVAVNGGNWRAIDGMEADRSTTHKPERLSIYQWKDTNSAVGASSEKFQGDGKQFEMKLELVDVPIISPGIGFRKREAYRRGRDDRSFKEGIVGMAGGQRVSSDQLEKDALLIVKDTLLTMDEGEVLSTSTGPYQTSNSDTEITRVNPNTLLQGSDDEKGKNSSNNSTSTSITLAMIPHVRSEKLVYQTNTTESPGDSPFPPLNAIGSTEGTLESPLIVSTQPNAPDTRFSTVTRKEKSWEGDGRSHSRKDHSKTSINLLEGQPNKIFYEIKPSLNTVMKADDEESSTNIPLMWTTKHNFLGFKLPSVPSSFGKFGPFFVDEVDHRNITERIGSTVQLDCRIGLLGDKKVTWFQPNKDSIRLLTVGNGQYSADERISLKFQYPDNWRLQIAYATLRDSGIYKCQVEIDPTNYMVKTYHVFITAPSLNITDDSGRTISGERHLKAGSTLRLRCEGRDVLEKLNESLLWTRGDEILTSDVSENRTTELVGDKEIPVISSTLVVEKASPRHAGNYSCIVPERAKTTIAVHVLNGELPAAVHHGSGVSSAVLNFWLIHLTVSYGFLR